MAISDPAVKDGLEPYKGWLAWVAPACGALLVVAIGKLIAARRPATQPRVVDLAQRDR